MHIFKNFLTNWIAIDSGSTLLWTLPFHVTVLLGRSDQLHDDRTLIRVCQIQKIFTCRIIHIELLKPFQSQICAIQPNIVLACPHHLTFSIAERRFRTPLADIWVCDALMLVSVALRLTPVANARAPRSLYRLYDTFRDCRPLLYFSAS